MSWHRRSLLAALITLSVPLASADTITVNTTTDDYTDNKLCSIREAVQYFTLDRPEAGFQGCKPEARSEADGINIPGDKIPYDIKDTAIVIERTLTINGLKDDFGVGLKGPGPGAVIQLSGLPHRAFVINNSFTYISPGASGALAPVLVSPTVAPSLTVVSSPTITVSQANVPAPAPGTTKMVTLYDLKADGSKTALGITTTLAGGQWTVVVQTVLSIGAHNIVYTVRDATDPLNLGAESPLSLPLNLAVAPGYAIISVTFNKLEILGCAGITAATDLTPTNCATDVNNAVDRISSNGLHYTNLIAGTAGNGGLIYAKNAALSFDDVLLHGGHAAAFGGAIYADTGSGMQFTASTIRENSAPEGGALYVKTNAMNLSTSLVTANSASAGAVVDVAGDRPLPGGSYALVQNSTVSENTGVGLRLGNGTVSASTIILNTLGGVDFVNTPPTPVPAPVVGIFNTILAGNTGGDCLNQATATATLSMEYNLLMAASTCPLAGTGTQTVADVNELIVPVDALECAQHYTGLLCRLADNGGRTKSYKPRILSSFTSVAFVGNKIINRGSPSVSGANVCPSLDQRGEARSPFACNIGSIQLKPAPTDISQGDSISYGQTYTHALADGLGDEELLDPAAPGAACPGSAPSIGAVAQYSPTIKGCPWVETPPTKGTVIFNADGTYTYKPKGDFHGYDQFTVRVITTLSRLNPSVINQSRRIQVTVINGPAYGIQSDSVGGATGAIELLLLSGMALIYRRRRSV